MEAAEQVEYVEDGRHRLLLCTAVPVSNVTVASYNGPVNAYEDLDDRLVRSSAQGEVMIAAPLPHRFHGFQAMRVIYTAGWTAQTLPRDLRDAPISLFSLVLQEISNAAAKNGTGTGVLKKVTSGSSGQSLPIVGTRGLCLMATSDSSNAWHRVRFDTDWAIGSVLIGLSDPAIVRRRRENVASTLSIGSEAIALVRYPS
ncbi:MAG: hypothetical protein M3R02_19450 [Chloroflexota bacterium]|nr:hypothetical protein [Chloroflexota bacterium]